jgi:small ligand-binding sensory domain FIST
MEQKNPRGAGRKKVVGTAEHQARAYRTALLCEALRHMSGLTGVELERLALKRPRADGRLWRAYEARTRVLPEARYQGLMKWASGFAWYAQLGAYMSALAQHKEEIHAEAVQGARLYSSAQRDVLAALRKLDSALQYCAGIGQVQASDGTTVELKTIAAASTALAMTISENQFVPKIS